jgi:hypothetical protein
VYHPWRAFDGVPTLATRESPVAFLRGERVTPESAASAFDARKDQSGTLLQELLVPHPEIARLAGDRLCSVRMVALVAAAGARLISCVWKIATGRSMADNYWEPGNLIAPIDIETGAIGRPFMGLGRDVRFVDDHPDTGRPLAGITRRDWSRAVSLCLTATRSVPGLPMQAWDVALTIRIPGMKDPRSCATSTRCWQS